jgi:hypothetical protein
MALTRYVHQSVPQLVHVLFLMINRAVLNVAGRLVGVLPPGSAGGRLLIVLCVITTLVIQGILIYWLAELVELCISLYELFPVLYRKHMEILSS